MIASPQSLSTNLVFTVVILALTFSPLMPGYPSIGLPPVSPGSDEPIQTKVRMISETVDLTIESFERPIPKGQNYTPAYWMRGLVEAQFTMRNLGERAEILDVWFPLAAMTRYPNPFTYDREKKVQDFKVWADGLPVDTQQVIGPDLKFPDEDRPWTKFQILFPPGRDVIVKVSYIVYPDGRMPFGDFEYILQTGSGWKDTIASATITVYMPDPITPESVSFAGESIAGFPLAPQPDGFKVENNTITWHFTDFEPTAQQNIFVNVLAPAHYRSLLQARAQAQIMPDSADAQLELARAGKSALMILDGVASNGGGDELGQEVEAAYERALELTPDRSDIYGEFASWLMVEGAWYILDNPGVCPEKLCDLVRRGLEMFPDDEKLKQIDEEIRNYMAFTAPDATSPPTTVPSPMTTAFEGPKRADSTSFQTAGLISLLFLLVVIGILVYRRIRVG